MAAKPPAPVSIAHPPILRSTGVCLVDDYWSPAIALLTPGTFDPVPIMKDAEMLAGLCASEKKLGLADGAGDLRTDSRAAASR